VTDLPAPTPRDTERRASTLVASPARGRIRRIGRWFGWIALALVLLTVLTGYGITEFRVVGQLTFGLLGKALSQRWHEYVGLLVVASLAVHVGIAMWWRVRGSHGPDDEVER
jgi:hypothetical protein